jgi:hypothetical protein
MVCRNMMWYRLAASACLVCALGLHASSDTRQESGQATWSAVEATHIFDSILWAMGEHFATPKQCVSDCLEQMQLAGGDALYSVLFTFYL